MDQSPHDIEKDLFALKRKMGAKYSAGDFSTALKFALDLEEKVTPINSFVMRFLNHILYQFRWNGRWERMDLTMQAVSIMLR